MSQTCMCVCELFWIPLTHSGTHIDARAQRASIKVFTRWGSATTRGGVIRVSGTAAHRDNGAAPPLEVWILSRKGRTCHLLLRHSCSLGALPPLDAIVFARFWPLALVSPYCSFSERHQEGIHFLSVDEQWSPS